MSARAAGLSLSLVPAWGETQSGVRRLWNDGATAIAANDDEARARVDARLGYGVGLLGGAGVLTPPMAVCRSPARARAATPWALDWRSRRRSTSPSRARAARRPTTMPTTASCCKGSCGSKRLESARIDRRMVVEDYNGNHPRSGSKCARLARSEAPDNPPTSFHCSSLQFVRWAEPEVRDDELGKKHWLTRRQRKPPVSWNGQTDTFTIRLSGLKGMGGGRNVEAEWAPPITYVVRIREASSGEWSYGFETPLTGCRFVGLKPDTEYEVEVRSKNAHGESGPARIKSRTNPNGGLAV